MQGPFEAMRETQDMYGKLCVIFLTFLRLYNVENRESRNIYLCPTAPGIPPKWTDFQTCKFCHQTLGISVYNEHKYVL
jgi:hypothetical protein